MPKVFLTGSGATRGYLTGSGFISNPPRYLIRQFDSATGSYPTIARIGDTSRMGNYSVSFDDTNTIYFEDPYATAEINFDMVFQTKIVPIQAPGIYYGPVNSRILGEGFKEVVEPTIKEAFLSPLNGDTITLTDADGSSVVFTFKTGLDLTGLSSNEVQIPLNRYNRKLLAKNFTEKINEHPGIKIQATLLDEPKNIRLSGRNNSSNREVFANGTIRLRQQKPGTAGNKAITKSLTAPSIFGSIEGISISDFSGGIDISRVVYPQLLNADITPMKIQTQGTATPNFSSENLDNSGGVIRKGISDAHIRFTKGEDLTAFNDSRIDIRGDVFYKAGTPENIYPGFSSKLSDKTQIVIDINASRDQHIFKQDSFVADAHDPGSEFAGETFTGFCYYNWDEKRWDQKGLNDPATGNPVDYKFGLSYDTTSTAIVTSSLNQVTQFTSPSGLGHYIDFSSNASINTLGYDKACSPHSFQCAPAANMYHATGSQVLKMNNYINSPFLLEKVTIDIPVIARFSHQAHLNSAIYRSLLITSMNANDIAEKSKDMMNYVFFLYKQGSKPGNVLTDSAQHVTSSKRTLIASGAACFFNKSVYSRVTNNYYDFKPVHNPSFSHGFEGGASFDGIQSFTGSIRVEMTPAVSPQIAQPFNLYPLISGAPPSTEGYFAITIFGIVFTNTNVPGFWYGGSDINPFNVIANGEKKLLSGKESAIDLTYLLSNFYEEWNENFETNPNETPLKVITNPQHIINGQGGKALPVRKFSFNGYSTVKSDAGSSQSGISPFLLQPEDELVLGVEKAGTEIAAIMDLGGLWSSPSGNKKTFLPASLSGSFMKITQGEAKITLYGSQIKDSIEFHDTLNQPLTSDAIHEAIHYDNPTIDQFYLAQRTEYVGGSLDQFNETGFVLRTSDPASRIGKKIESLISGSTVGMNGAFTRYRQAYAFSQIYFDSLLPDVEKLLAETADPVTTGSYEVTYAQPFTAFSGNPPLIQVKARSLWPDDEIFGLLKIYDYPFGRTSDSGPIAYQGKNSFTQVSQHDYPTAAEAAIFHSLPGGNFLAPPTYIQGQAGHAGALSETKQVPCPIAKCTDPTDDDSISYGNITYEESKTNFAVNTTVFPSPKFFDPCLYPYKSNPKRTLTQREDMSLLLYQLLSYNMFASGTFVGEGSSSAALGHDGAASDANRRHAVNSVISGFENSSTDRRARLGYISGSSALLPHLFGGTRNSTQSSVLTNAYMTPTASNRFNDQVNIIFPPPVRFVGGSIPQDTSVKTRPINYIGDLSANILNDNFTYSYGLINSKPQRRKSYYRADRFTGQVADLVHPGFDTAFSQIGARLGRNIRNFKNTRNEPLEAPVVVKFVESENLDPSADTKGRKFKLIKPSDLINSSNRQSSNMSTFATSSMPFFDDDVARN